MCMHGYVRVCVCECVHGCVCIPSDKYFRADYPNKRVSQILMSLLQMLVQQNFTDCFIRVFYTIF